MANYGIRRIVTGIFDHVGLLAEWPRRAAKQPDQSHDDCELDRALASWPNEPPPADLAARIIAEASSVRVLPVMSAKDPLGPWVAAFPTAFALGLLVGIWLTWSTGEDGGLDQYAPGERIAFFDEELE